MHCELERKVLYEVMSFILIVTQAVFLLHQITEIFL